MTLNFDSVSFDLHGDYSIAQPCSPFVTPSGTWPTRRVSQPVAYTIVAPPSDQLHYITIFPCFTVPKRGYHAGNHRAPTMNDMPKPEGDFYKLHAERQAKYNRALIIGALTLGTTLWVAKESKLIYFNFNPPKSFE